MRALLASTLALAALLPLPASAQPDLRRGEILGGLLVYPDARRPQRHYYPPGELELAHSEDGAPRLALLMTRYVGTGAAGDRGAWITRSLLSFHLRMKPPDQDRMAAAREALKQRGIRRPELRPLPVERLEAALAYQPLRPDESGEATGEPDAARVLPEGHFDAAEEGEEASRGSYWSERPYVLRLSDEDAQAFGAALAAGQTLLSVSYAFFASGIRPDQPITELTGSPELVAEIRRRLGEGEGGEGGIGAHLVRAGAVDITLDVERWPGLVSQVDLNARVPPGYGVLSVYCYDFRDRLAEDLYEKRVEIVARGVTGDEVRAQAVFNLDGADLYAKTVRFPLAVRLDVPYRYRLRSIRLDGSETVGEWREAESWNRLLDVTHRPQADVRPDDSGDDGGNESSDEAGDGAQLASDDHRVEPHSGASS